MRGRRFFGMFAFFGGLWNFFDDARNLFVDLDEWFLTCYPHSVIIEDFGSGS